jgi:hypothetical protein
MNDQPNLESPPHPRLRLADAVEAPAAPAFPDTVPPRFGPADREVHLTDYIKVLHKRRWTAITVFLVVLAGGTVITFTEDPADDRSG